jgi:hypothetical protein
MTEDEISIEQQEKWRKIELRVSLLSMCKEILERNAALRWEQDKTKGLSVTAEELIKEAESLLEFVTSE